MVFPWFSNHSSEAPRQSPAAAPRVTSPARDISGDFAMDTGGFHGIIWKSYLCIYIYIYIHVYIYIYIYIYMYMVKFTTPRIWKWNHSRGFHESEFHGLLDGLWMVTWCISPTKSLGPTSCWFLDHLSATMDINYK